MILPKSEKKNKTQPHLPRSGLFRIVNILKYSDLNYTPKLLYAEKQIRVGRERPAPARQLRFPLHHMGFSAPPSSARAVADKAGCLGNIRHRLILGDDGLQRASRPRR